MPGERSESGDFLFYLGQEFSAHWVFQTLGGFIIPDLFLNFLLVFGKKSFDFVFFLISKIVVSGPLVVIFGLSTSNCSFSTKNQLIWLQLGAKVANSGLRLSFLSLRNKYPGSKSRLSFLIMVFLNAVRGGVHTATSAGMNSPPEVQVDPQGALR